ncbi:hypothetical protein [Endozoicomonas sp. GU-1]|uniref:hypothetical protein n=1 Tax=Endozoicomonas sp. GU-1 TaxID=3009078 RepID=UPI0022B3F1AB|nr:hypothetical protein [Endozoicomonas sp. GU-1]WBA79753.1 hypothetical protein O2T12_15425 [Endozoicomonas sp. GU-1]
MLLSKYGYPPVTFHGVYRDVVEQAEHFKAGRGGGSRGFYVAANFTWADLTFWL